MQIRTRKEPEVTATIVTRDGEWDQVDEIDELKEMVFDYLDEQQTYINEGYFDGGKFALLTGCAESQDIGEDTGEYRVFRVDFDNVLFSCDPPILIEEEVGGRRYVYVADQRPDALFAGLEAEAGQAAPESVATTESGTGPEVAAEPEDATASDADEPVEEPYVVRSQRERRVVRALEGLGFDVHGDEAQGAKELIAAAASMTPDSVNAALTVLGGNGVVERSRTTVRANTHVVLIEGAYVLQDEQPKEDAVPVAKPEAVSVTGIAGEQASEQTDADAPFGAKRSYARAVIRATILEVMAESFDNHIETDNGKAGTILYAAVEEQLPEVNPGSVRVALNELVGGDDRVMDKDMRGRRSVVYEIWVLDSETLPASVARQEAPDATGEQTPDPVETASKVAEPDAAPARVTTRTAVKAVLEDGPVEGGARNTPKSANAIVTKLALAMLPKGTERGAVAQMLNHLDNTDIIRRWETDGATYVEWTEDESSRQTEQDPVSSSQQVNLTPGDRKFLIGLSESEQGTIAKEEGIALWTVLARKLNRTEGAVAQCAPRLRNMSLVSYRGQPGVPTPSISITTKGRDALNGDTRGRAIPDEAPAPVQQAPEPATVESDIATAEDAGVVSKAYESVAESVTATLKEFGEEEERLRGKMGVLIEKQNTLKEDRDAFLDSLREPLLRVVEAIRHFE